MPIKEQIDCIGLNIDSHFRYPDKWHENNINVLAGIPVTSLSTLLRYKFCKMMSCKSSSRQYCQCHYGLELFESTEVPSDLKSWHVRCSRLWYSFEILLSNTEEDWKSGTDFICGIIEKETLERFSKNFSSFQTPFEVVFDYKWTKAIKKYK